MFQTSYSGEIDDRTLAHTGLLPSSMMPEALSIASRSFLIYNPGTEMAHTIIRIAGDVGDGMLIRNLTTGQRCRVIDLKSDSLLDGQAIELDSFRGQTRKVLGDHIELAFPFHDEGYITLAPCTPFIRTLRVNYTAGSNIITPDGGFLPHMAGQFVYLDGWKSIRLVSNTNRAVISESMPDTGSAETPVVPSGRSEAIPQRTGGHSHHHLPARLLPARQEKPVHHLRRHQRHRHGALPPGAGASKHRLDTQILRDLL